MHHTGPALLCTGVTWTRFLHNFPVCLCNCDQGLIFCEPSHRPLIAKIYCMFSAAPLVSHSSIFPCSNWRINYCSPASGSGHKNLSLAIFRESSHLPLSIAHISIVTRIQGLIIVHDMSTGFWLQGLIICSTFIHCSVICEYPAAITDSRNNGITTGSYSPWISCTLA